MRHKFRRVIFVAIFSAATLFATSVQAQSAQPNRMFGAQHPFTVEDLPPSRLRSDLERLPLEALGAALENLHRFNFPAADAAYLRADKQGGIFYEDPLPPPPPAKSKPSNRGPTGSSLPVTQIQASVDVDKAFKLHSKPGAANVIYLNMAGAVVTNTIWNGTFPTLYMLPYSQDSDYNTFTQSELDAIAETWKRIAEDFAPFDVDVTTEKPASFGPKVGHILVTRKADLYGNPIYNCSCGGVAYVNVWGGGNYPYYQPALVFVDGVGTGPHNITEAASHEIGHNLSLSHDGTSSTGYYTGQGSGNINWAPIMGVGYYGQVTQWSRGEYSGANNTQDDMALIAQRLAYLTDDHESGADRSNATPLVLNGTSVVSTTPVTDPDDTNKANKGIIETRNDVDFFYVDAPEGTIDLTITPAWLDSFYTQSKRGANLDIRVTLYSSNGQPVTQSDAANDTFARIIAQVPQGRYYIAVEGVGVGDPLIDGYSDYASVGQYFINGSVGLSTLPTMQFGSPTYSVSEGSGSVTVTVTRSSTAGSASVAYTTSNGSAISASDYTSSSGSLSFAAGETSKTIAISILNDATVETNENFFVTLSNPSGATLGSQSSTTLTILDDDVAVPTVQFGASSYSVIETRKSINVAVTRSSGTGTASVDYATANGTATEGSDYTARRGTINFASGVTSSTITIPIVADKAAEAAETFTVNLSNPQSATLGTPRVATVTIRDK